MLHHPHILLHGSSCSTVSHLLPLIHKHTEAPSHLHFSIRSNVTALPQHKATCWWCGSPASSSLLDFSTPTEVHCTAKSIHSPIQIIEFRCPSHLHDLHDRRCLKSAARHAEIMCGSRARSQELRELPRGATIGCLLCNRSSCGISSQLNIPQSAVSGIITKWKQLGTPAAQL